MKMPPAVLSSIYSLALVLVSVLLQPRWCLAAGPSPEQIAAEATQVIGKYNALGLAATPLIDHAIDKGNDALEQRLEQLNAIIQSAIFNLNQVLKERMQDADEKIRIQRMEAIRDLDRLSNNINNLLQVSFDQLD